MDERGYPYFQGKDIPPPKEDDDDAAEGEEEEEQTPEDDAEDEKEEDEAEDTAPKEITDELITERTVAFLRTADMETTTERQIRKGVETELDTDLTEKKLLVRGIVTQFLEDPSHFDDVGVKTSAAAGASKKESKAEKKAKAAAEKAKAKAAGEKATESSTFSFFFFLFFAHAFIRST